MLTTPELLAVVDVMVSSSEIRSMSGIQEDLRSSLAMKCMSQKRIQHFIMPESLGTPAGIGMSLCKAAPLRGDGGDPGSLKYYHAYHNESASHNEMYTAGHGFVGRI